MIRPILTVPHMTLLKKSEPVKSVDASVHSLIKDMTDTLLDQEDPIGVGISAPQIGVLRRVCLIRPDEKGPVVAMINPEIISSTQGRKTRKPLLEGCLSIPGIWGYVLRPEKVEVRYLDAAGNTHTEKFSGFESIIVQHEIDHLDGILFTKHTIAQGYQLYQDVNGELEPYSI